MLSRILEYEGHTMLLMFATALLVAPVMAQTPDPAPTPKVKEKKICRADANTGTRLSTSTCHTKAEWDAIAQQNARNVDSYRQQGSSPR
ncbi:hypothetical protein U1872_12245 [Sphingomonas sp. RB3P16]|uniref:hypothetical protein n=1 Tax=Parasphingomonas frigoris TaxID=3096163 RepID=UPI002FCBA1C8